MREIGAVHMTLDELKALSHKHRARMGLLSFFYTLLSMIAHTMPQGILSIPVLMYDVWREGFRRLFSWLSYSYWLDQGRGSLVISNMVPKDMYGPYKNAAIKLLHMIPDNWVIPNIETLIPVFQLMPYGKVIENIALVANALQGLTFRKDEGGSTVTAFAEAGLHASPWSAEAEIIINKICSSPSKALVLSAPTGTGKSTMLPPLLLDRHSSTLQHALYVHTIVILEPRNVLVRNLKQFGLPVNRVVRVNRDTPLQQGCVNIMTYGYFKAAHRLMLRQLAPERTLVILDEFHEQQADQLYCNRYLADHHFARLIASATPNFNALDEEFEFYAAPIPPRHIVPEVMLDNWSPVNVVDKLIRRSATEEWLKPYLKRILVIHPSLNECTKLKESFSLALSNYKQIDPNISFNILSKTQPVVPETGHIIATQIVDAGITIPGVTLVVDSGLSTVNHMGGITTIPSTMDTCIQRKGRTGRTGSGLYIRCSRQFTNATPVSLPSVADFLDDELLWRSIYKRKVFHPVSSFQQVSINDMDSFVSSSDDSKCKITSNQFAVICGDLAGYADQASLDVYVDLLLDHSQDLNRDRTVNDLYDSMIHNRINDETEHIYRKYGRPSTPLAYILAHRHQILFKQVHNGVVSFKPACPAWNHQRLDTTPTRLPRTISLYSHDFSSEDLLNTIHSAINADLAPPISSSGTPTNGTIGSSVSSGKNLPETQLSAYSLERVLPCVLSQRFPLL
jgi:hypothetical protein